MRYQAYVATFNRP